MATTERFGAVTALAIPRRIFGIKWSVRCYAVDGVLVDSGLAACEDEVLEFATREKIESVILTHHHEDHSGAAPALVGAGLKIAASRETARILARGFSVRAYQRVLWGKAPRPFSVEVLGSAVDTRRHRLVVHAAPGHCVDQIVFHEENEGWLFSGDAFIAERVRYFREDEDFRGTLISLEALTKLDFDDLFCAHRPVEKRGREALLTKLEHLRELEGKVLEARGRGWTVRRITRSVLGREGRMAYVSFGDLSKANLVKSILGMSRPRAS